MSVSMRASSFINSIGINTHIPYTDGKYANVANVIADLKYLGITHIRDAAPWVKNNGKVNYAKVADAGFKYDFITQQARTPAEITATLAAFQAAHPGSIEAIEGPNEINNWPVTFNGKTGVAAAVDFQEAVNSATRASTLHGVAIYSFTGANATTSSDYTAMHAYAKNGSQPYHTLELAVNAKQGVMAGKPTVLTETGYATALGTSNVDQATQAKLTLNSLMDATKLGISRTYLYQLLDAYKDPTGSSLDKNNGLFDLTNAPKQAAVAVHNLTTLLADNGANADTFTTHDLAYSVSNLPTGGKDLMIEKSNGEHDIVLWGEPDIWDEKNHVAITAATNQATVSFGSEHHDVAVFDPLVSATNPIATFKDVTSVQVGVSDHPLILEVAPVASNVI